MRFTSQLALSLLGVMEGKLSIFRCTTKVNWLPDTVEKNEPLIFGETPQLVVTTHAGQSRRGGLQQFLLAYTGYAPLIRAYLLLTLLRTSGPQALLAGGGTLIFS